ncbi:MAG: hypothetical protein ACE5F4_01585 [Candidatus Paceibacteria bacterium]
MELTILLSQVFGIYLIIVGAAIMLRKRYFIPVFASFVDERLTRALVAIAELITGLFLILTHNVWTSLPAGIISFAGWALAVEGTLYLLLSDNAVEKLFRVFNVKSWYIAGGIISIALGIYLAGFGFGYF